MQFWTNESRAKRNRKLSRVCRSFAAVFGLLSVTILLFIPEVSLLSQADGTKYFYIDRQFDLPTGDPEVFSDYSLLSLSGVLGVCSVFYLVTAAFFWGRQASPAAPVGAPVTSQSPVFRSWRRT